MRKFGLGVVPGAGRLRLRSRAVALALCLLAFVAGPARAQTGSIGGAVVAERSLRPLAGAQVLVAGTDRATVTDANGRFLIPGLSGQEITLEVTLIGYRPVRQTVRVGELNVRVPLAETAIALDQIVVTGTAGGTQKRAIGTSVAQINAADVVETAPVNSVQDLLNARAPGVVIIPGSGTVGSGARIRIRGVSSLSLSQEPLIYVDGVRVNNDQASGPITQGFGSSVISRWNDFNPDDIESIEVIKGPAAATLYGTEAANGVIQIITKRGAQGTPRFNLRIGQGANWFANPAGRLPDNYGVLQPGYSGPLGQPGDTVAIDMVALEKERGRSVFQTGYLQEYDLSVSGGSTGFRYYLAGGLERNEGIEPNNRVERYSARANLTVIPNDQIDITASLGYVNSHIGLPWEAGGGGVTWSTYFANPARLDRPNRGFYSATPEAYYYAAEDWQDADRFTGSLQLNHKPFDWFRHRLTLGTDLTREENAELMQRIEDPEMQFFFSSGEIRGYKEMTSRAVYYNTLDYSASATLPVTERIASQTSAGAQYYRRYAESVYAYGEDFPVRGLRTIDAATGEKITSDSYVENATVGIFVQQQFSLDDRLFLTAAMRMDDNSAFGRNYDLVRYPKVSATWVVSEEPFWSVPQVNQLRLRAAYGESGQQPETFAALRTYAPITGPGDQPAVTPQLVGNPDLGPERGREVELGFDAGFLDDRLGVELTYYSQRTRDAILLKEIAPSTGFTGLQYINAGEVRNSGLELLARARAYQGEKVGLDFTFSLASNDNEVVDLGLDGVTSVSGGTLVQHREGYPAGSWFDRRIVDAEFDANGRLVAGSEICDDGNGGTVPCAGAPTVFLGRPTPDLEGALSSTLTLFGNLRINALVDFKRGHHKMDGNLRVRCVLSGTAPSSFGACRERYYPTEFLDDPAWLAQTQRGGAFVNGLINDASFTRLREVSASYTLPQRYAGVIGASNASITLAGRNLYTWTGYAGLEPEASFLGGSRGGASAQWEQNVTPQLTQFVATFNVSF